VYLIAEIGTNFPPENPLLAVRKALEVAQIAKVQIFKAEKLYALPKYVERLKPFEFNPKWLSGLDKSRLWASVFDPESAREAASYVSVLKIASGDITNEKLIKAVSNIGLPVAISTGAATVPEVFQAIKWAREGGAKKIILFQCVSAYPARPEDYNLRAILPFKKHVESIGLSDHTTSPEAAMLARALGYQYFEHHFRFQEEWSEDPPPDWGPFAFTPKEFKEYSSALMRAEEILGDGVKRPMPAERKERLYARRGKDGLRPVEEARNEMG